jgi:aldose 1-epimerase
MKLVTLRSANGVVVRLADWGATLLGIDWPHAAGTVRVVLGPGDPERELARFPAAGAILGRFANRIAGARFDLDGTTVALVANEGRNQLHGGAAGFAHRGWTLDQGDDRSARFRLTSPDGDQGYPGTLDVSVTYALSDEGELSIAYEATTDRATPINLTHHAYFNLAGGGDVLGHELWLDADGYLPIDREKIPTGEIAPVDGTPFDFREPRTIGDRIAALEPWPGGYDHCMVLRADRDPRVPAARLRHVESGRTLEVITDQPGIQLYTGNHLHDLAGAGGVRFPKHGGVCLETQHFPDSVHHPEFPPVILRPGERFASRTVLRPLGAA